MAPSICVGIFSSYCKNWVDITALVLATVIFLQTTTYLAMFSNFRN
jgi:hypothetical protein